MRRGKFDLQIRRQIAAANRRRCMKSDMRISRQSRVGKEQNGLIRLASEEGESRAQQ